MDAKRRFETAATISIEMKDDPITTRFFPSCAAVKEYWDNLTIRKEKHTSIDFLGIIEIPESVHILEVSTIYGKSTGWTSRSEYERVVWDRLLPIIQCDGFLGRVNRGNCLEYLH